MPVIASRLRGQSAPRDRAVTEAATRWHVDNAIDRKVADFAEAAQESTACSGARLPI
jgi:hypothetical protein